MDKSLHQLLGGSASSIPGPAALAAPDPCTGHTLDVREPDLDPLLLGVLSQLIATQ